AAVGGIGQSRHRRVHAGLEDFRRRAQLGILAVMGEVWPVTAYAGGDRLAALGMIADGARQAQQLHRPVEVQFGNVLGDRGALGLLALAHLDIGTEATGLAGDFLAGLGVSAERGILRRLAIAA